MSKPATIYDLEIMRVRHALSIERQNYNARTAEMRKKLKALYVARWRVLEDEDVSRYLPASEHDEYARLRALTGKPLPEPKRRGTDEEAEAFFRSLAE